MVRLSSEVGEDGRETRTAMREVESGRKRGGGGWSERAVMPNEDNELLFGSQCSVRMYIGIIVNIRLLKR